jgi:hypothetical protein
VLAPSAKLWPIAVSGKNHLLAGSDVEAERSACVYMLVATCVLEKPASGWPRRWLEELLSPLVEDRARDCRADALHLSCYDLSATPPGRGGRRARYHIDAAPLHCSE